MTAASILTLAALVWAILEVAYGIRVRQQRGRIRAELRAERTQQAFAEARGELMSLAIRGELDANSWTFRMMYHLQTMFMRRPEQYPRLSTTLRAGLSTTHPDDAPDRLAGEHVNWSADVRRVVAQTADAIDGVLLDYSAMMRFTDWLIRRRNPAARPSTWLRPSRSIAAKRAIVSERMRWDVGGRLATRVEAEEVRSQWRAAETRLRSLADC